MVRLRRLYCLPQEREGCLRGLVGLRQDGDTGLLQDLVAHHLARERGDVGVADAALAALRFSTATLEALDGVLEAVLGRTEGAALGVHIGDGAVELGDERARLRLRARRWCRRDEREQV